MVVTTTHYYFDIFTSLSWLLLNGDNFIGNEVDVILVERTSVREQSSSIYSIIQSDSRENSSYRFQHMWSCKKTLIQFSMRCVEKWAMHWEFPFTSQNTKINSLLQLISGSRHHNQQQPLNTFMVHLLAGLCMCRRIYRPKGWSSRS